MKGYRVFGFDFDARVHTLSPIPSGRDEEDKELQQQNQTHMIQKLQKDFGVHRFEGNYKISAI